MKAMVQTSGLRFPTPKTETLALKGTGWPLHARSFTPAEAGFRMTSIKRHNRRFNRVD
jgi:hypothetical protein